MPDYFSKWKLTNRIFCQGHQLSQTVRVLKCNILTMYSYIIFTTKRNIMTILKSLSSFNRHSYHWWLRVLVTSVYSSPWVDCWLKINDKPCWYCRFIKACTSSAEKSWKLLSCSHPSTNTLFIKNDCHWFLCECLFWNITFNCLDFILYWNTWLRKPTGPLYNSDAMV